MFGLGTTELLVIGVILFFLFGAKRLPEIGKGLGGAIREFRNIGRSTRDDKQSDKDSGKAKAAEVKPLMIEAKIKEKVMEQIPGAKQALNVKKKAEIIKDVLDS